MMCCSEGGGKCNYWGDGSCLAYRATSDTVALVGNWVPKLVPSTVQANINMTGNGKTFMVLGPQRPLFTGKETLTTANTCLRPRGLSRQGLPGTTSLSWLSSPGTQRSPSRSPSRPLGNKRQTLSQDPGLCEQGISNGHNPFLVCHLLECNCIFSGTVLKTMAFLLIFLL